MLAFMSCFDGIANIFSVSLTFCRAQKILELWFSTYAAGRHQFPDIKFLKATKIKPFSSFATAPNLPLLTLKLFEVLLLQLFSNKILFTEDPTLKFHIYNYIFSNKEKSSKYLQNCKYIPHIWKKQWLWEWTPKGHQLEV